MDLSQTYIVKFGNRSKSLAKKGCRKQLQPIEYFDSQSRN